MAVLDTILLEELISAPTAVTVDFVSEAIDLTFREAEFSIQLVYDGGVSVDMDISIEGSNDDVNYSTLTDSTQNITDATGSHIWDIAGSGVSFLRARITVNTGSINLTRLSYRGKRRH